MLKSSIRLSLYIAHVSHHFCNVPAWHTQHGLICIMFAMTRTQPHPALLGQCSARPRIRTLCSWVSAQLDPGYAHSAPGSVLSSTLDTHTPLLGQCSARPRIHTLRSKVRAQLDPGYAPFTSAGCHGQVAGVGLGPLHEHVAGHVLQRPVTCRPVSCKWRM